MCSLCSEFRYEENLRQHSFARQPYLTMLTRLHPRSTASPRRLGKLAPRSKKDGHTCPATPRPGAPSSVLSTSPSSAAWATLPTPSATTTSRGTVALSAPLPSVSLVSWVARATSQPRLPASRRARSKRWSDCEVIPLRTGGSPAQTKGFGAYMLFSRRTQRTTDAFQSFLHLPTLLSAVHVNPELVSLEL